jgi:hypothetical protein
MLRCTVVSQLMSQLGHKRTSHQVRAMSALPPKADIVQRGGNVRFVSLGETGAIRLPRRRTRSGSQVQSIQESSLFCD